MIEQNATEPVFSLLLIALLLIFLVVIIFTTYSRISRYTDSLESELTKMKDEYNELSKSVNNMSNIINNSKDENFNLIQFPESLDEKLNKFMSIIKDASQQTYNAVTKDHSQSLTDIKESMLTFRDMTTEKSNELNQYKEGYDFIKQKNIISDLISLNIRIKEYRNKFVSENNDSVSEHLNALSQTVLSILNNNHIEEFSVNLGENILEVDSCDVINQTIPSNNEDKINTIAEIISPGYRISINENDYKIIKKIKVKIFSKA